MTDAIIVALITGACAIISQIVISRSSTKELYAKLDKQSEIADTEMQGKIKLIQQEVAGLREEVSRHNNLVERTYKLERDYAVLDQKTRVADKRIADLENHRAG